MSTSRPRQRQNPRGTCAPASRQPLNRRECLKALGAAATALGAPWVVPARVLGANAPSNRIHVGQIGCGHQSQRIIPSFLVHDDMQMVAVCDVNRQGVGYYYPQQVLGRLTAKKWVEEYYAQKSPSGTFQGCEAYGDFRQLLDRQDIDAVTIVVPDHWHALIAVAAMRAGKDVYCEKPMALNVRQGQEMVKAARRYQRVFQTGAQFRSCPVVRKACELVRNGRLGKLLRVHTKVDGNSFPSPGVGWKPQPIPDGFDYEFWLGPAPQAPYHPERCFHRWRYILDYSNGQTANFGAHVNDIVQWALGTDLSGPVEFEDRGAEFPPPGDLFTAATKTSFAARYANGVELFCETAKGSSAKFEGTEGRLEVTLGGRLATFPVSIKDSEIGKDEIHLPVSVSNPVRTKHVRKDVDADHVRNFLDAVKSRKDPIQPAEVGHRSASLCILGNIAQRLKRKFAWDPAAERSPDEEVNRMLSCPQRAPWVL